MKFGSFSSNRVRLAISALAISPILAAAFPAVFPALFLTSAHAHLKIQEPNERPGRAANGDPQKNPPCGITNEPRSSVINTFKPGATVRFRWIETVSHGGYFRIAMDPTGANFTLPTMADWQLFRDYYTGAKQIGDLPPPVVGPVMQGNMYILADYFGVHKSSIKNRDWFVDVKMPDIECSKCTVQIIQLMADKSTYSVTTDGATFYFHCVDTVLNAGATPTGGTGGNGSGSGGAGGNNSGGVGGASNEGGSGGQGGQGGQGDNNGSAGSGGQAGGVTGGGGEGGDQGGSAGEGGGGGSADEDDGGGRGRGSGCSFVASGGAGGSWILGAVGLALLVARRRRKTRVLCKRRPTLTGRCWWGTRR